MYAFYLKFFSILAAPPSTKPTLKDYLNAGGVPRPSGAVPQPYPGYVNPATSSHQQYRVCN